MAVAYYDLTGDITDLTGGTYDANTLKRVRAWVETNLPPTEAVVDSTGNKIMLGAKTIPLNTDGTFTVSLPSTVDSAEIQPNSRQYRVWVEYPDGRPMGQRIRWSSGWFNHTAAGDLADKVIVDYAPVTYSTALTQQLDAHAATLQAPMDAAVTDAQGYADDAAASAQQAHDISNISTSDGVVTALVNDDASTTKAALTATDGPILTNAVGRTSRAKHAPALGLYFPEAEGAVGDGATDDTAAMQAAASAAAGQTLTLRGGATYAITAAVALSTRTRVTGGLNSIVQQGTAGVPAFDCLDADDVTVEGFRIVGAAPRAYVASPSIRGSANYIYSAGVWSNGNRGRFTGLIVSGFTSAVYLTSWNGTDFNRYKSDNVVDNVIVFDVDFGLLAVGQDRPMVSRLRGSYSLSTGSPNPPHLIYWSDGAVGTSASREVTVSDCTANDGTGGHAYQFKGVTSGRVSNMGARSCAGLFSVLNCQDMQFVGFSATGDLGGGGNGSIFVQGSGTEARLRFAHGSLTQAAADQRAVRLDGTDSVLENVQLGVIHSAVGSSADITVQGTRCRVENVKVTNSDGNGGWYSVSLAAGSAHSVRNVVGVNVRGGVQINSGVTGALVEVDGSRFTPPAGYTGLRVVEDNNTTAPLTSVSWPRRQVSYSVTGGTITPLPANANSVDITITASTALTIANPPSYQRGLGQTLTVSIYNSTAGAMGTTTLGTDYETATALASPAAGVRLAVTFAWNGAKWREISRA